MLKFKKIILLSTIFAMLSSTSAFAFNDISDPLVETSANTLFSLGIINGTGNNNFNPDGNIKRSEFAKIAVLTLGGDNISGYKNFTIFPDVPHTHWSSAYVNAAVIEYSIIKGLPDGTFNPEGNITYAEAITMMLYMLDYEIADIGAHWPQDYIDMASDLGLTDNLSFMQNDFVTRGDATIMITNLLHTPNKEGALLIETAFPHTDADGMILATSASDSSLSSNQVRVSIGGLETVKTCNLQDINLGATGIFVYENSSKTTIDSFLPEGFSESFAIKNIYIDKILTESDTIYISSSTPLLISGKMTTYGEAWLDIFAGSEVTINYNSLGNIESICANNQLNSQETFLFDGSQVLSSAEIYKNGVKINISDINVNDVVSVSNNKAFVSDNTITGFYSDASPSVFYPSEITILGSTLQIPENVRSQFNSLNLGDIITIFLDSNGNVSYAKNGFSSKQDVYVNSFDGSTIDVTINGFLDASFEIDPDDSSTFTSGFEHYSTIYKNIGKFATLNYSSKDTIRVSESNEFEKISGDYTKSASTIGTTPVASNVAFFEAISSSSSYTPLDFLDVTLDKIPAENILSCAKNSSGEVDKIIFTNLTGDNLDYGLASCVQEEIEYYDSILGDMSSYKSNKFTLSNFSKTFEYPSINYTKLNTVPVGIQKGLSDKPYKQIVTYVTLDEVGTVSADNFLGSSYINTDTSTYTISSEVVVYDSKNERFVELNYARQNYTEFTFYIDNSLQGSMVRVIIVK